MFSIYSTIFNIDKEFYSKDFIEDALFNFRSFVGNNGEIVFSIPKEEKSAKNISILEKYGCKIVFVDINKEDILFVGKLKNIALQFTTFPAKVGLDLDERIPLRHKNRWENFFRTFDIYNYGTLFIHSLDLWCDIFSIKNDLSFYENKFKWYMHKDGLFRGVVNFAKTKDGIDISKTDTCELIDSSGNLPLTFPIRMDKYYDLEYFLNFIENEGTFVYHLGYANLDSRLDINNSFWREFKKKRNRGKDPFDIKTEKKDLICETIKHNLPLWND